MKYLTIDTTTKVTALALAEDEHLVGESFLHITKTHSERLIPMLDQLLIASGWNLKDLDLIGVVRGPGSFTGIRIGIATAQGIAQVLNIPMIGVVSLDCLAWSGVGREGEIIPILDARKNEWYSARYAWNSERENFTCLTPPFAANPDEWLEELAKLECGRYWFAGDAVEKYQELIRKTLGDKANLLHEYERMPRGAYAKQAVWKKWKELNSGERVEPYYIRLSEAEVKWKAKEEDKRRKASNG